MNNRRTWLLVIISALVVSSVFCTSLSAGTEASPATQPAAELAPAEAPVSGEAIPAVSNLSVSITEISGTVQVLRTQDGVFSNAVVGSALTAGDQALAHANSQARMDFSNGTMVRFGPLTLFTLKQASDQASSLELAAGRVWVLLNGGKLEVSTPSGTASVQGSSMNVSVDKSSGETVATCLEGACVLSNDAGTVNIAAGQSGVASSKDAAPVVRAMSEADMQDWLYLVPEAASVMEEAPAATLAPEEYPTSPFNDLSQFPTATPTRKPKKKKTPTPEPRYEYWYPYHGWGWDDSEHDDWYYYDWGPGYYYDYDDDDYYYYDNYYYYYDHDYFNTCGPPKNWTSYYVRWGDTLGKLARRFDTSVWALQEANCLGNASLIYAGTYLWVPK